MYPTFFEGSASRIHQHTAPKRGPPLEFINNQHQPKNGGPPLGTISMDLAVPIRSIKKHEILKGENLDFGPHKVFGSIIGGEKWAKFGRVHQKTWVPQFLVKYE